MQEIDLNSNAPIKPEPAAATGAETNQIREAISNLKSLVKPGQTNEEFVDSLINAPESALLQWENCELPSRGLYYGWSDGIVKVKPMGQMADKILATERLAQSGQSIDFLFREHCQFPAGFDPVNLLVGDRVFLLYFLRGITHGNVYEFMFTCPNKDCSDTSSHRYDLNELAKTIVWADDRLGAEPFKVVLPYLSKASGREVWVGVRFLRAADANEMLARQRAKNKNSQSGAVRTRSLSSLRGGGAGQVRQELDETITQNLEKIIVSIMGVADVFAIRQFIPKMHAQDTAAVREWLREHTPGIDATVEITCPKCEQVFTMELPIKESFFRPAKS